MAKQIVFSVDLDVESAEKKIEQFMTETVSAKTKLRELQTAAREASVAGNDALANTFARAAGEVKDAIGDANSAINNFSSDTKKLDVAIGTAQGLAGAFATVQGTMALFAGENENLQKTLTKVQGSIAVLNGLQQVANILNKESAVGAALYAASQRILNSSLIQGVVAANSFKKALISTGIGAVVVALGTLIAYWQDIAKWIGISGDKISEVEKRNKEFNESLKKTSDELDKQLNKTLGESAAKYEQLTAAIKNTSGAAKKSWIKEAIKDLPELMNLNADALDAEQKVFAALEKRQKLYKAEETRNRNIKELTDLTEKIAAVEKEWGEAGNKNVTYYQAQLVTLKSRKNELEETNIQLAKEIGATKEGLETTIDAEEKKQKAIEKTAEVIKSTQEEINAARRSARDQELARIEDENKRTIAQFDEETARELSSIQTRINSYKKGTEARIQLENLYSQTVETRTFQREQLVEKLRVDGIKKEQDAFRERLTKLKEQVELDGKITIEELESIQKVEREMIQSEYDNKLIDKKTYDEKILALERIRKEKQKEIADQEREEASQDLDKRLKSLDLRYELEDLKAQANSETLRTRAAEQTAIFQEQLNKGIISQEEFNLKKAQLEESVTAKEKEENDKRREDRQRLNDFVIQSTLSSLSFLSDMNDLFASKNKENAKKAFENNKKIQIAETLIQTYAAAQAVFANAAANPATILFPAQPYIQAGIAVAAGLAKVAKIKATKFEGGGGGGDNAPAPASAPQAPTPTNVFAGQAPPPVTVPGGIRGGQQQQRVYVLETDITRTQDRVKVLEQNANAKF